MASKQSSTDASAGPVLVIEHLTKQYGSFTALNDLTLSLNSGEILGLIGPNGAGKTTTIKILVGLSRPTSGTATIGGVDCVKDSRRIKSLVGYMPDTFGSYDNMRVREYLDFFGAIFGIAARIRAKRIAEVMEITGTAYMKDRFVESLSHGMQQRVGLARTLIHDPKVLILDEPVNGLDPQARIEMRDLLIQLSQRGKTLLVTSHILPELARICTRVAIMTNGTLRTFGTVEEIGRQVSQQRTIETILISSKQVSAAAAIVRQAIEPGAEVIEAPTEATVRFRTSHPDAELTMVLARLMRDGIQVTQFREVQTDLEEAFMSFARPQAAASTNLPSREEWRMFKAVVLRELASMLRRRRMLVMLGSLVIVFGLLVALRWPTDSRIALTGTRSRQVFQLFSYGLLATMLFLLPVFPSTSIVKEKKQGTLALLLNSPLGPVRIFFGKLASILVLAGFILVLSLPASSACYAMGGLSLSGDLFQMYLLLFLVALQFSVLALLISSFSNTIDGAVRFTYGTILLLSILTLGPHYFFQGTEGIVSEAGELLRCLSPFSALMSLTGAGEAANQGLMTKVDLMGRFAVSSLGITVVGSLWTIARLNHTIFDRNRSAGTISDDQSAPIRAVRRVFFLVDPQRRSSGISSLVNPLMVKEFRCRRFGRLHWLLRLVSICAMLSLGLTYAATAGTLDWGVETIGGILVVMQVALVILITPSLSAGLISSERESRGWQLLRTTPASVGSIVWGKLLSVILPLLLILCATLPGYIVMVYIEPGMALQVRRVVICLVATAVFAMLLSAAVGSLFSRTAAATAAAYGALLSICCVPLLIWMGRDAPFGHSTVEAALTVNPVAAALSVIRMPGFQNYALIPANWWFLGIASLLSLCVLLGQTYRISRPQ